ncbi:MAG: DNA translocase FtsK [Gammaproteobacteria bacterium]|nr:MAG: DNA translocase FtsK [Gammaproteobacteria bacterium]
MAQATRIGQLTFSDYFQRVLREAIMWALFAVALFLVACLFTYSPEDPGWTHIEPRNEVSNLGGPFGAWFADVALSLFGYFAYLLPFAIAWSAWLTLRGMDDEAETRVQRLALRLFGFLLTLGSGSALAGILLGGIAVNLPYGIAGGVGQLVGGKLVANFHQSGSLLLLAPLFLAGVTFFTGLSWLRVLDGIGWLTLVVLRAGNRLVMWFVRPSAQEPAPGRSAPSAGRSSSKHRQPDRTDDADLVEEEDLLDLAGPASPLPGAAHLAGSSSVPVASGLPLPKTRPSKGPRADAAARQADKAPDRGAADTQPGVEADLDVEVEAVPEFRPVAPRASKPGSAPAARLAPKVTQPDPDHAGPTSQGELPLAPLGVEPQLPSLQLLDEARRSGKGYTKEQLDELSRQVEIVLADFGVSVQVVAVHPGPVVTLFEMMPAPGTKASKITGLSRDIARALSTISVRVVEVIPGKSVIGLEIPNKFRETVALRELLGSSAYQDAKSPLTIALGTNISGHPVVADLARMPHALIAGTTGSGKSVALNGMILSLVYKAGPRDVRLIMVDPKMLELSVYEGIPHLLTPVVTDMKEAANALRWCVAEMERRYKLMARLGVRNIGGYNRRIAEAEAIGEPIPDPLYLLARDAPPGMEAPPALGHLPYIVVIIDELADMMMVVGKKVEELIARLAQKARASGIHLLLATQRPSVDVLTGLIKANIPTRMAFQVSSRIDSRTILDQMGAEQLLGNGDMLYLPPGTSIPYRVHGAFVDDHEVHQVVEFLRAQGEPEYIDTILMDMGEGIPGIDPEPRANGGDLEDTDPLFDEAVQIVVESRRASISGVQRRLKIGYNRAARMIEEMERIGIVGPAETNGNREVLAPPPME